MSRFIRGNSFCSKLEQYSALSQPVNLCKYSHVKKRVITFGGFLLLLPAITLVTISSAFAQIGGTSTGVDRSKEIVCENRTTNNIATSTDSTLTQWDCAAMGLLVMPGDVVVMSIKAYVSDPSNVGGSSYGLTAIDKIKCNNKTTGQATKITPPNTSWNCSSTGLGLQIGDIVKQSIRGTVAAVVAVLPETPAGLSATAGDSSVTLSWNPSVGADYYHVYSYSNTTPPTLIADSLTTTFTQSGLLNGMTYSYGITAINATGESPASTSVTITPVVLPFDHATVSATQTCASCHSKNAAHLPSSDACEDCHTTTTWLGAIFDHNGITTSCSTCHNGLDAIGKPTTHLVTAAECDLCHRTTTWLSVSYTHGTGNYPGDHSLGVSCVSCHLSSYDIANWRFVQYKPWCAGCHANSYSPAPHNNQTVEAVKDCGSAGCHRVSDRAW